jgi:hypothetical protein
MLRSRLIPSLLAVILIGVGCGQGDDGGTTTSPSAEPSGSFADDLTAASETIVEDWGDEDGFAVLLLAVDSGYSVAQIVDNPTLTLIGTIDEVEPEGPSPGLLADPPEEAASGSAALPVVLAMTLAQPSDWGPGDTYIDFIDNTVSELFDAARDHLETVRTEEQLEAKWELSVTVVAAGLLGRGYSPQQVIEALLLGEVTVSTGQSGGTGLPIFCYSIASDPPVVAPNPDLIEGDCPPLGTGADNPETESSNETTTSPPSSEGPPAGDGDRYVGSVDAAETGADPDLVLENTVELIAADDLTGTIVLLGNATIEGVEQSDGFCFYLRVDINAGSVPATAEGGYAGSAEVVGGLGDTPCTGGPPNIELTTTGVNVDATVSGDTLIGTLSNEGEDPITFTATRQP